MTAAHELEAATSDVNSVKADLLDTPAKTLAGLIFKARYAAREDNAYDEDVMESIVEDLLAIAAIRRAPPMSDATRSRPPNSAPSTRCGKPNGQIRTPASRLPRRAGRLRRPTRTRG